MMDFGIGVNMLPGDFNINLKIFSGYQRFTVLFCRLLDTHTLTFVPGLTIRKYLFQISV